MGVGTVERAVALLSRLLLTFLTLARDGLPLHGVQAKLEEIVGRYSRAAAEDVL